jgi:hypothetical protein
MEDVLLNDNVIIFLFILVLLPFRLLPSLATAAAPDGSLTGTIPTLTLLSLAA